MLFVSITTREYDKLIRDSERLNTIKDYLESEEYPTTATIKTLAGISKATAETTTETTESEEK